MNKSSSNYSLERQHAPNVDPEWASEFIVEARLREVPGTAIGDALAEIDSHVADSGESAQEAFGDPKAYAVTWSSNAPKLADTSIVRIILPAVMQTLGMLAVLNALTPALDGEPFGLTVGHLGMLAVLAAAFVLLGRKPDSFIRLVIDRPFAAFGLTFLWLGALVGVLFIPGVVATMPAWWVVALGAVVLAAATVVDVGHALRTEEDPIVSPNQSRSPRSTRFCSVMPPLMIPAFTLVLATLIVLL